MQRFRTPGHGKVGLRSHRIGFITYPAFSAMTFAATSVFEFANWKVKSPEYQVTLLSEYGGPVASSLGPEVQTTPFKRHTFDTIVVAGDHEAQTPTPALVAYLKSAARRSVRIASICTGAF